MWHKLWYWIRSFGCADHYLVWMSRDGRRYGQCMECLAETRGWEDVNHA